MRRRTRAGAGAKSRFSPLGIGVSHRESLSFPYCFRPTATIVCSPDGRRFTLCSNSHPIIKPGDKMAAKKKSKGRKKSSSRKSSARKSSRKAAKKAGRKTKPEILGQEAHAERGVHEADDSRARARHGSGKLTDATHRSHQEALAVHQAEGTPGFEEPPHDQRRREPPSDLRPQHRSPCSR